MIIIFNNNNYVLQKRIAEIFFLIFRQFESNKESIGKKNFFSVKKNPLFNMIIIFNNNNCVKKNITFVDSIFFSTHKFNLLKKNRIYLKSMDFISVCMFYIVYHICIARNHDGNLKLNFIRCTNSLDVFFFFTNCTY